jgi:glycosyltransferase involved in cell wall biosynthesis
MRILHVVAPADVGGAEAVVHSLAVGQRGQGHDVHVAAVLEQDRHDHPFVTPLLEAGVGVFPLILPPRRYLRERSQVAELCRRLRPDVVHTHGYRPDVVDAGAARRHGIPTVTTVHGFTGGGRKNRFYERLQRLAFRRFDAVVAVSRLQAGFLLEDGVPAERIHCVPNAWPQNGAILDPAAARERLGVPNGCFHVGWVGRLSHEKAPGVLIDALPHLTDLPILVSILGDGRQREALEQRAAQLGVAKRINWCGTVQGASSLFSAFDVFVLSSRTEGMPMVLFEAMAAYAPIVATCVGGVPDVLSAKEALLVPPEDPGTLAAGIRSVYVQDSDACARASQAHRRLEEFALRPWLARYEDLYREVQSSAARSAS